MTAPVRTATVQFKAEGVPDVQAATRAVQRAAEDASKNVRDATRAGLETAADRAREKWGMAGREIAKSMADLGRTGQLAGRELKQLAVVGGEMAVMFSPMGNISSAVALLTLGITQMFVRMRDESRRAAEAVEEDFKRLARGGSLEAQTSTLMTLYSGDQWASEADKAKDPKLRGLAWLRGKNAAYNQFLAGGSGLGVTAMTKAETQALAELEAQYAKVAALVDGTLKTVVEKSDFLRRLGIEQKRKEEKEALKLQRIEDNRTMLELAGRSELAWKKQWREKLPVGPAASDWMQQLLRNPDTAGVVMGALQGKGVSTDWQKDAGSGLGFKPWTLDEKQWKKDFAQTLLVISDHAKGQADNVRKTLNPIGVAMAEGIAETLQSSLSAAFETLFSGGGLRASLANLARTMVAGIGHLLSALGSAALMASKLMSSFLESIAEMNPWKGAAIAVAMMAAGAALGAAARGATAAAGGGGGSAYAASAISANNNEQVTRILWGADSVTVAAGMTPRQSNTFVIVGPGDPQAQRAIQELLRNANRRGGSAL